jgi:hypothetical protein
VGDGLKICPWVASRVDFHPLILVEHSIHFVDPNPSSSTGFQYRVTSLTRSRTTLGTYRRPMPGVLESWGGALPYQKGTPVPVTPKP